MGCKIFVNLQIYLLIIMIYMLDSSRIFIIFVE